MKQKLQNLIVALYITGCGAAAEAPLTTSSPAANSVVTAQQTADTSSTGEEAVSFAVADSSALPPCDKTKDAQLAFARAEKAFYVCDVPQWDLIDLRGAPGRDGKDGQDGEKGLDGANGKDGSAGKDGAKGDTGAAGSIVQAPPAPTNEVYDFSSGKYWTKAVTTVIFTNAPLACLSGFRLPTEMELKVAIVSENLPNVSGCMWADSGKASISGQDSIIGDVTPTQKCKAFCIQE